MTPSDLFDALQALMEIPERTADLLDALSEHVQRGHLHGPQDALGSNGIDVPFGGNVDDELPDLDRLQSALADAVLTARTRLEDLCGCIPERGDSPERSGDLAERACYVHQASPSSVASPSSAADYEPAAPTAVTPEGTARQGSHGPAAPGRGGAS